MLTISHLLMVRWVVWINPSWWTHWAIFFIPANAPILVQRPQYVLSCLWDSAYKRTLVTIGVVLYHLSNLCLNKKILLLLLLLPLLLMQQRLLLLLLLFIFIYIYIYIFFYLLYLEQRLLPWSSVKPSYKDWRWIRHRWYKRNVFEWTDTKGMKSSIAIH